MDSDPGQPWEVVQRSAAQFGNEPSLVVLSMGLRWLHARRALSPRTYSRGILQWVKQLRSAYPRTALLVHTMGASFDTKRSRQYAHQFEASIARHNLALLRAVQGTDVPVFNLHLLQAQPSSYATSLDGIHYLEGTGVNEAAVQLLLNRMC